MTIAIELFRKGPEETAKYIHERMWVKKLNIHQLSIKSNVTYSTLYHKLRDKRMLTYDQLCKVLNALE